MADFTFPGVTSDPVDTTIPPGVVGWIGSQGGSAATVTQAITLTDDATVDLCRMPASCTVLNWKLIVGTNVSSGSPLGKIEIFDYDDTTLGSLGEAIPLSYAAVQIFDASADAHLASPVNTVAYNTWRAIATKADFGKAIQTVRLTVTTNGTWQAGVLGFEATVRRVGIDTGPITSTVA